MSAAFKKLHFCYCISGSVPAFIKLLINTKRFTWSKEAIQQTAPVAYPISLPNGAHTIYLRTFAGDLQIFYEIFLTEIYRLPPAVFLQSKTIVDIGAHIGMTALYFQAHCAGATVHCIEADPDNFELLVKNLPASVVATHAAISDSNEPVYLQKDTFSFNTQVAAGVSNLSVAGISIQSFLNQHQINQIDIIKIDIEGAERVLFTGDTSWLSITKNILIETHSEEDLALFREVVGKYGFIVEAREFEYETIYWAHR